MFALHVWWLWTQGPRGGWGMLGVHEELQSTETVWAHYTRIHIITQQGWGPLSIALRGRNVPSLWSKHRTILRWPSRCMEFSNVFIFHSCVRPLRVSNGLQIRWNPLKSQTLGSFVWAMRSGELEDVSGNQQFWLWAPLIVNSNWRMIWVGGFIVKM